MSDDATTDRAQRQRAVASGDATTAVDALDRRDPGAGLVPGSSRSQQFATQREIAGEIGADPDGVATTATPGGMDAFLRSSGTRQFAASLREDFASEADFVERRDVAADIDPQAISGRAEVARDRRNDVAERAREETAADSQFIEPGDLEAEVTGRGVAGLGIPRARRDDVAQRARRGLASEDPFADPEDFKAEVGATGIESAGLTDAGAERRAAAQFTAETPLADATRDDVTETDDGFRLDAAAQERVAARRFEDELDVFGQGELSTSDVRETDDGFGLGREPARELAAANLSKQVDGTVSPDEVTLRETDSGRYEGVFEQEVNN